ncbi:MAG: hypothetical protein U0L91_03315 [Gemmiger sp.]|uniref:hypothetical protein n=1 Tax=Gemmiger sp. TaxID=2049027 RepID=UPI002E7A4F85|nr:hypothetical protein [Gemmiger sp.]MEE0800291.1 hypothetical protein [Gemmiger sp.]
MSYQVFVSYRSFADWKIHWKIFRCQTLKAAVERILKIRTAAIVYHVRVERVEAGEKA